MAHCIVTSTQDYINLKEALPSIPERILKASISIWQDNNGLENWPTLIDMQDLLRKAGFLIDTTKDSQVNYALKVVGILQSEKAEQVFSKGQKNKWSLDKILTELAVPKEQKQLLLELGVTDREQLALELASKYGFTVEVNTAKATTKDKYRRAQMQEYTPELDAQGYDNPVPTNTTYYSNLTVPGGTNYTENEISTPLITPSIKGHAQFSTDNGIGWFRSDDAQTKDNLQRELYTQDFTFEELLQRGEIKQVPCG